MNLYIYGPVFCKLYIESDLDSLRFLDRSNQSINYNQHLSKNRKSEKKNELHSISFAQTSSDMLYIS